MNKSTFWATTLLVLGLCDAGVSGLHAEVRLPGVFTEGMVLQRAASVPVWGKATPGQRVRVTLGSHAAEATAGPDGAWIARLDLERAEAGPFDLVVEAGERVAIPDVLVGEVWLISGQSNMGHHLGHTANAPVEIAASANPWIRELRVTLASPAEPADDVTSRHGRWVEAGPRTTGQMSGVGYYFAKYLGRELKTPVGLLHASVGGTPIEAWMRAELLECHPDLAEGSRRVNDAVFGYPARQEAYAAALEEWQKRHGRAVVASADARAFAGPDADTASWTQVELPTTLARAGLPDAGVVWLRRTVEIAAAQAGKHHYLDLPILGGNFAEVYWNGELLDTTDARSLQPHNNRRRYDVVAAKAAAGTHTVAVRLWNPVGGMELDPRSPFRLVQGSKTDPLKGPWLAKVEHAFPALGSAESESAPRAPTPPPFEEQQSPSRLYNGMIAPLERFAVRGVLWYQGESNGSRGFQYREAFPLLITDWRERFGWPALPFYWCQIANYGRKTPNPGEDNVADLRESQTLALALPHTGQAILIDTGDADDVHGGNKQDPGERLARIALANTYGRSDVAWTGPAFKSANVSGGSIIVNFTHVEGGLVAKPLSDTYVLRTLPDRPATTAPLQPTSPGSQLQGFAICGADRRWVWAQAAIEGDTVRVWSPEVPAPVAVRYGWAKNPTTNLYSAAGLPVGPFRSDDFPLVTQSLKYGFQ